MTKPDDDQPRPEDKPGAFAQVPNLAMPSPLRSRFQFAPSAGWMNDPNGLFFFGGYYHLFFQHNPADRSWGPMHWGHAVSKDMISWTELPIALEPDELGCIFSGTVVVDAANRSGLARHGGAVLVAFFTHHDSKGREAGRTDYESQSIALSHDGGWTWEKYPYNPVLRNQGDQENFRDPFVFWHEETAAWIMVLAAGQGIKIYRSKSLTDWTWASDFRLATDEEGVVWECPALCRTPTSDGRGSRWVLIQSFNPGGRYGGSGTQYVIGDFDGFGFRLDPGFERRLCEFGPHWFDWGPDNYAAISWANLPEGTPFPILVGWMNNWAYARETLESPSRGRLTLPRAISLAPAHDGLLLRQRVALPDSDFVHAGDRTFALSDGCVIVVDLIAPSAAQHAAIILTAGDTSALTFTFDPVRSVIHVDRSAAHPTGRPDALAAQFEFPRLSPADTITVRLYLSPHAVEAFFDDGMQAATVLLDPTIRIDAIRLDGFEYGKVAPEPD